VSKGVTPADAAEREAIEMTLHPNGFVSRGIWIAAYEKRKELLSIKMIKCRRKVMNKNLSLLGGIWRG
jgi:hypothetical protein